MRAPRALRTKSHPITSVAPVFNRWNTQVANLSHTFGMGAKQPYAFARRRERRRTTPSRSRLGLPGPQRHRHLALGRCRVIGARSESSPLEGAMKRSAASASGKSLWGSRPYRLNPPLSSQPMAGSLSTATRWRRPSKCPRGGPVPGVEKYSAGRVVEDVDQHQVSDASTIEGKVAPVHDLIHPGRRLDVGRDQIREELLKKTPVHCRFRRLAVGGWCAAICPGSIVGKPGGGWASATRCVDAL